MRENLKQYNAYLDEIIKEKNIKNKEELLDEILTQIKFFQHERLIHLIVTMSCGVFALLFAILCFHNKLFLYPTIIMIIMLIFYIFGLITNNIGMFLLFFVGILLFFPYILHYYYLENGTQALYKKYFQIKEK